ncbi:hypothetical protein NP493_185g03001 [Ridgeia piscesae]|uniref:Uncharacterized protein n=1 Tax=Ridgeia piscesae TaxID=27915 RepID=A0AAD9P2E3_RIDPI|nr:hypothetical protein NP493_185g03001 [Ridgeia piscesae]
MFSGVFWLTAEAPGGVTTPKEASRPALLAQEHYASREIQTRCEGVIERRDRVKTCAVQRRKKLIDSLNYQQFLANMHEVMGWITAKLTVASDESYRDPTNLQGKTQKHQAFEAELSANKRRIDLVHAEGSKLVETRHYASEDISDKLSSLDSCWQGLVEASREKTLRLQQAYQALLFYRQCDDVSAWIDDVEVQLSSEDHGKDVTSANILLKKHQLLEEDTC